MLRQHNWCDLQLPSSLRATLPAFQLDFGYVVYGLVVSHPLTLTNVGHCPVSFTTSHRSLEGTGFSVDLGDRVRSLPGEPEPVGIEFSVRFDPAAVHCPEGRVENTLPFNVRTFERNKIAGAILLLQCTSLRLSLCCQYDMYNDFLQLVGGPTYVLKLSADVTRPSMQLSSTQLDFGTVVCGQCRILSIRLHNPYHVK